MELNRRNVIELMKNNKWSPADLARAMGVSPATVSRILNGKRGTGKKVIAGLLNAFPDSSMDELFFLSTVSSNENKQDHQTA